MKKILLLLLTGAMLLTACTSGEDGTGSSGDGGTEQTDPGSNTLGDDDGDGLIEDGDDGGNAMGDMTGGTDDTENGSDGSDGSDGSAADNGGSSNPADNGGSASGNDGDNGNDAVSGGSLNAGGTGFTEVDRVGSAADAVNFIGANVYSRCPTAIPLMTETRILSTEDRDSISYNTGLTDTSGIDDVILSESASNAVAYSFVMLRTDGTNTPELQKALGEGVNPGKWSGLQAEKAASVVLDNDVILVMGSAEQVDTILNAVTAAAKDVYENVGSVVPVMG